MSVIYQFRVLFWKKKTDFWPKKCRFSLIPAGARSVIAGHFLTAQTVPPSFVGIFGPKAVKFGPKLIIFGQLSYGGTESFASSRTNKDFWPKICIFWSLWANIGLYDLFGAMPDRWNNANKVLQWFSDMCVPQFWLPHKIIRTFGPKRPFLSRNMLSWAHTGLAVSFGALFVGWLVVVVHRLYLARYLFTLSI